MSFESVVSARSFLFPIFFSVSLSFFSLLLFFVLFFLSWFGCVESMFKSFMLFISILFFLSLSDFSPFYSLASAILKIFGSKLHPRLLESYVSSNVLNLEDHPNSLAHLIPVADIESSIDQFRRSLGTSVRMINESALSLASWYYGHRYRWSLFQIFA